MTNAEIIKDFGIELTGDAEKDNKIVNDALGIGAPYKIVKYLKNGDKHKKITLSPISFEIGFCEQVWSKLDLPEKLRVMKWASEDYLQKNGYGTNFPPFVYFTKNDYDKYKFNAMAFEKSILLSLEYLNKCKGYEAAITIIHESIHELDFKNIDRILEFEVGEYVNRYDTIKNFRTARSIMQLPIKGKIINMETGLYEYVTDDLRKKILLCKNKVANACLYKNTPQNRNSVITPADFDKYLASDFYFTSPIENKAYNESINMVCQMAKNNSKTLTLTKDDAETLNKYHKFLTKLNGRKLEIQKQFKMPIAEALNMEFEHIFNKLYYGNNQENYICKSHMQKREEIVKRFWNLKHVGKGEYKEGATEQIK